LQDWLLALTRSHKAFWTVITRYPDGVAVAIGGTGVSVAVGVSVGDASGAPQLAEMDGVVPSGLVKVAVRVDPSGLVTAVLAAPVSENAAFVGPPGSML
jgi:hypothetical protein